jgi:hypothetical protein
VQRREGRVLLDAELEDGLPVVVEGVQRMREAQSINLLDTEGENNAFLVRNGQRR